MSDPAPPSYPISALPAVAVHIKTWLEEVSNTERTVRGTPAQTLKGAVILRRLRVHRDMQRQASIFEEQLRRWHNRPLSLEQREELNEAAALLGRVQDTIGSILAETTRLLGDGRQKASADVGGVACAVREWSGCGGKTQTQRGLCPAPGAGRSSHSAG